MHDLGEARASAFGAKQPKNANKVKQSLVKICWEGTREKIV